MFTLSIGAIFKNEEMVIIEWLDHHIYHGVDHFYLIDDASTDNSVKLLQPYIEKKLITLFSNQIEDKRGRQEASYNKYFIPILKDTKWLAIIDIDEYLYSPTTINIKDILINYSQYAAIYVNWCCFGSNGHITQPKSVVQGFTKCCKKNKKVYGITPFGYDWCGMDGPKTIINTTNTKITNLSVHSTNTTGPKITLTRDDNILIINHYITMSIEYWQKVKMTRGDVNRWHSSTARDMEYFKTMDQNDEDDLRLANQNM